MSLQLRKWFFKWIFFMAVIILVVAFFFPTKKIDLATIDFQTKSSSSLYFKNMRAYFYDMEELSDGQLKLYRIGSREKDSSLNKLNFLLVNNWRQEECYIMAESSLSSYPETPLYLKCIVNDQNSELISLSDADSQANYRFAAKLYEHLSSNHQVYLKQDGNWLAFNESEKKSLKRSLKDYFKWVGKLN